jgi:ankyrin repeat and BTB/POZ domain-containing protein 1
MVLRKFELEGKLGEETRLIESGVLLEENPLDESPEFNEFLMACRHGDLKRCQELISQGVNINGKDRFDYTPLIIVSVGDVSHQRLGLTQVGKFMRTL